VLVQLSVESPTTGSISDAILTRILPPKR
jgi:hypothetical protein